MQKGFAMKRILVIEDDPMVREVIQEVLQMNGFESVTLNNGSNALNLHRKFLFDLVITDIIMPIKDGIETIIELIKEFPSLKIIAMSGGGSSKDGRSLLEQAKLVGAYQTLAKPLRIKNLLHIINELLS